MANSLDVSHSRDIGELRILSAHLLSSMVVLWNHHPLRKWKSVYWLLYATSLVRLSYHAFACTGIILFLEKWKLGSISLCSFHTISETFPNSSCKGVKGSSAIFLQAMFQGNQITKKACALKCIQVNYNLGAL